MDNNLKRFFETKSESKAIIVDSCRVRVTTIDGENFELIWDVDKFLSEETKQYQLHLIELIFDENFKADKEVMINNIWRDAFKFGLGILGMSSGDRQNERLRIGKRIRQIREDKRIEAQDLAKLANIDAANLSRIENGKYSVGLDILSRIASALGKQVDLVDL